MCVSPFLFLSAGCYCSVGCHMIWDIPSVSWGWLSQLCPSFFRITFWLSKGNYYFMSFFHQILKRVLLIVCVCSINNIQLDNLFKIMLLMKPFLDLKYISPIFRCVPLKHSSFAKCGKTKLCLWVQLVIHILTMYMCEATVACGWLEQRCHGEAAAHGQLVPEQERPCYVTIHLLMDMSLKYTI